MSIPGALAESVSRRMGGKLSPPTHAAADYLLAASFFAAGLVFWRRDRRAAVAALACGAAKGALIAVTEYPGLPSSATIVDFRTHGNLELALAGAVAAMPEILSFEKHRRFFTTLAAGLSVLHNLTDFGSSPRSAGRRRRPFKAA